MRCDLKFCKKCGKETNRSERGDCVPCKLAYAAYYRAKNPEKVKASCISSRNPEKKRKSDAAYNLANKESLRLKRAKYRALNAEKFNAINATNRRKTQDKKEQHAIWRAENPEKVKDLNRAREAKAKAVKAAYIEQNRAKITAYHAAKYLNDADRIKARNAAWNAAHHDAMRVIYHNRRAKKRANGGVLSKGLAEKLFKLQRGKCACCGLSLGNNYHMDHIIPIALGGPNTDDNIQLLRQRCNNQKNAKHPIDFMQERGFLL